MRSGDNALRNRSKAQGILEHTGHDSLMVDVNTLDSYHDGSVSRDGLESPAQRRQKKRGTGALARGSLTSGSLARVAGSQQEPGFYGVGFTMQDEALISSLLVRARRGNEDALDAFRELIVKLLPRIRSWRWMVNYLDRSLSASDFAQDVVLKLWQKLPELRSNGIPQLLCWLMTTSKFLVKDSCVSARAKKRDHRLEGGSASNEAAGATTPATAANRADFRRRVDDFVVGLPPFEREVFRHKVWGGESFEKIAADLGVSKTATFRTFHQILAQLRDFLGGELEDWI